MALTLLCNSLDLGFIALHSFILKFASYFTYILKKIPLNSHPCSAACCSLLLPLLQAAKYYGKICHLYNKRIQMITDGNMN